MVERKKPRAGFGREIFQFNYDSVFVEIVADDSKYEKSVSENRYLGWNIY